MLWSLVVALALLASAGEVIANTRDAKKAVPVTADLGKYREFDRKLTADEMADLGLHYKRLDKEWTGYNLHRKTEKTGRYVLETLAPGTLVLANEKDEVLYKEDCGNRLASLPTCPACPPPAPSKAEKNEALTPPPAPPSGPGWFSRLMDGLGWLLGQLLRIAAILALLALVALLGMALFLGIIELLDRFERWLRRRRGIPPAPAPVAPVPAAVPAAVVPFAPVAPAPVVPLAPAAPPAPAVVAPVPAPAVAPVAPAPVVAPAAVPTAPVARIRVNGPGYLEFATVATLALGRNGEIVFAGADGTFVPDAAIPPAPAQP